MSIVAIVAPPCLIVYDFAMPSVVVSVSTVTAPAVCISPTVDLTSFTAATTFPFAVVVRSSKEPIFASTESFASLTALATEPSVVSLAFNFAIASVFVFTVPSANS